MCAGGNGATFGGMLTVAERHRAMAPALIAVTFAAGAMALLSTASIAVLWPDGIAEMLWLFGMALAAWAVVATITATVMLWRRRALPASSATPSAALLAAAVALLAITVWLHPFVGSVRCV